jgi:hypothetical protein
MKISSVSLQKSIHNLLFTTVKTLNEKVQVLVTPFNSA